MHTDELTPGRGLLPLRCRWDAVTLEDVAYGLIAHGIAQIVQYFGNPAHPDAADSDEVDALNFAKHRHSLYAAELETEVSHVRRSIRLAQCQATACHVGNCIRMRPMVSDPIRQVGAA